MGKRRSFDKKIGPMTLFVSWISERMWGILYRSAIVLIVVFVLVYFNRNWMIRLFVEHLVSSRLQTAVSIHTVDSKLSLKMLSVRLNNVYIKQLDGFEGSHLANIDHIGAVIELPSLFKNYLHIYEMVVNVRSISLAYDYPGTNNYQRLREHIQFYRHMQEIEKSDTYQVKEEKKEVQSPFVIHEKPQKKTIFSKFIQTSKGVYKNVNVEKMTFFVDEVRLYFPNKSPTIIQLKMKESLRSVNNILDSFLALLEKVKINTSTEFIRPTKIVQRFVDKIL